MSAIHLGLADTAYRALPGVSASSLRPLGRTPADYRWARDNPRESSPSQVLGTLVHLAVLTPDEWPRVAVAPDVDRRTKAGKETLAEWTAHLAPEDIVATAEDRDRCNAMVDALSRHAVASSLLAADGDSEVSVEWDEDPVGACKARVDRLRRDGWVVDLKTTRETDLSASAWSREVVRYDYHVQIAHYLAGLDILARDGHCPTPQGWAWVVVSTEAPHHVAVHVASSSWRDVGERERRRRLSVLAECRTTGNWPAYPDPISSGPPRWLLAETNA